MSSRRILVTITVLLTPCILHAADLAQYWKTVCQNHFVVDDLPGKPEPLQPTAPQVVQISDDPDRTLFQDYTIYAAGVEDQVLVALFDSHGVLLDYFMRRIPKGAQFVLKQGTKKNEGMVVLQFPKEDKKQEVWLVQFTRPSFKQ